MMEEVLKIPYVIRIEPEYYDVNIFIASCHQTEKYTLGNKKVKVDFPKGNKEIIRIYLDNNTRIVLFKDSKENKRYKYYVCEKVEPEHYDETIFIGSYHQTEKCILEHGKVKVDFPKDDMEVICVLFDDNINISLFKENV